MSRQQPDPARDIEQAKRNAAVARARVQSTVGALKQRLSPSNIAADAKARVKETTGAITEKASGAVRERPVTASAAAGAAALFLFRKPMKKLARRLFRRRKREEAEAETNGAARDEGLIRAGAPPKPSITPKIERAVAQSNAAALNKE